MLLTQTKPNQCSIGHFLISIFFLEDDYIKLSVVQLNLTLTAYTIKMRLQSDVRG